MEEGRISKREAAALLGVTPQSVTNLTAKGVLSVTRIGKWNYYNRDEIIALIPKTEGIRDVEKGISEVEAELERTRNNRVTEAMVYRSRYEFIQRLTDTATFYRYMELFGAVFDIIEKAGRLEERMAMRERDILDQIIHLRPTGEIAQRYGLTENRVKQIFEKALRRMIRFSTDMGKNIRELEEELHREREKVKALELENRRLRVGVPLKSRPAILDKKIRELTGEFQVRTANCLVAAAGCDYVRDILRLNRHDIKKLPNFGKKSMADLDSFLERHGLELGEEYEDAAEGVACEQ